MKIIKIKSWEEVLEFLIRYDASATRKISDRVYDMEVYAKKLFNFAENYMITCEGHEGGFFSFYNNDMTEKRAYLSLIAINPDYQRMKMGSQALQFICQECKKKQMKKIRLEVDKINNIARLFYVKNGFSIIGDASEYSLYMERKV